MTTYSLDIEGMSCGHCVKAVEGAIATVAGVRSSKVEVGHAEIEADEATSADTLAAAIEEEGYKVTARAHT